jgi:hypothetical protein
MAGLSKAIMSIYQYCLPRAAFEQPQLSYGNLWEHPGNMMLKLWIVIRGELSDYIPARGGGLHVKHCLTVSVNVHSLNVCYFCYC